MMATPTTLRERCDQLRERISVDQFFAHMGWDDPSVGRIRCLWPEHDDANPSMQVYPDTWSVHCFACANGGRRSSDLIALAQAHFSARDRRSWTVDATVSWFEETFDVPKPHPVAALSERIAKQLKRGSTASSGAPSAHDEGQVLLQDVRDAFERVERSATPLGRELAGNLKDYVWDMCPGCPCVKCSRGAHGTERTLWEWVVWAKRMIHGSYSQLLQLSVEGAPSGVVDDRPVPLRRRRLWEFHRDSDWSTEESLTSA